MSRTIRIGVINFDQDAEVPMSLGYDSRIFWQPIDCADDIDEELSAVVVNTSKPLDWVDSIFDKKALPHNVNSFYFNLATLSDEVELADFTHKLHTENSIYFQDYSFIGETFLPTEYGDFLFFAFKNRINDKRILGVHTQKMPQTPTVRVHSMCYTGDIFHSLKCDCREEFVNALRLIDERGGMLVYPEEEGRGIGVLNKISVYQHQHLGMDTVEAQYADDFPNDLRNYDYLKDVFRHFDIRHIDLITNNPNKSTASSKAGVYVRSIVQLPSTANEHNESYLTTKNSKSGHTIKLAYTEKQAEVKK